MGAFSWFYDYAFLVVWYSVEFTANIAVIFYVLHTFGWWKVAPPKQDVPATFDKTLQDTKNIFSVVGDLAGKVKGALHEASTDTPAATPPGKMTRQQKIELLQKQAATPKK